MKNKHKVHNLIVLDESGSMDSIKSIIISGFNELVQTVKGVQKQFPKQDHRISLITFNGLGNKIHHFNVPVEELGLIDKDKYQPDSMTPLFDAMGFGIAQLQKVLEKEKKYNVLVTILTDGLENASREYSGAAIKKLVEQLKLENWTFTYIGTDHNVEDFATSISITNTLNFIKSEQGTQAMFQREREARTNYSRKLDLFDTVIEGYYDEDEEVEGEEGGKDERKSDDASE